MRTCLYSADDEDNYSDYWWELASLWGTQNIFKIKCYLNIMEIESESLEDIELGIHFANDTLEKIEKLLEKTVSLLEDIKTNTTLEK